MSKPLNALAGLALASGAAVAPFLFVLSLPWNDYGVWPQTEMATVALHGIAAISAIALALLLAADDERARKAVLNPVVVALALFGMAGLALAPFHDDPWRTVHGTVKLGIGSIWHVELAVMVAAYGWLNGTRGGKVALAALVAATLAAFAIHLLPSTQWPLPFEEWVGLLGLAVAATLFARGIHWAGLLVFILGVVVSDNKAVMLAGIVVGALAFAPRVPFVSGLLSRRSVRGAIPVLVSIIGMVGIWLAAPVVEHAASAKIAASSSLPAPAVLSKNPLDHVALHESTGGTLWSRSYMLRTAFDEMLSDPKTFLLGKGWGEYPVLSIETIRDVPGRAMPVGHPTASLTYWDVQQKANFHVHNLAFEALLSMGVFGLVGWLAILGLIAASSRGGFLLATGIAVAGTFWFPVNLLTPALAFAIGSILPLGSSPRSVAASAVAAGGLLLSAAVSALCAILLFGLAVVERNERFFAGVKKPEDVRTCTALTSAFVPEVEVNLDLYRLLVRHIQNAPNVREAIVEKTTNILSFSCVTRRYWNERRSVAALATSLELRNTLINLDMAAQPILVNDIQMWGADVDAILSVAPRRTDFAVPYMVRLRQRSPAKAPEEAARLAARMRDGDPVKSWLLHVAADGAGDGEAARIHLLTALDQGFANIFPIASAPVKDSK